MAMGTKSAMYVPYVCTSNIYGNIDYGMPILFKSTDYRTCTGTYGRYIPNVPYDFSCEVKPRFSSASLEKDSRLKDEAHKTTYGTAYRIQVGGPDPTDFGKTASHCANVHYMINLKEKMYRNPPPPTEFPTSTMKNDYAGEPIKYTYENIRPPQPYAICEISDLGKDDVPSMRTDQSGPTKLLETYLTTTMATHVPFTKEQQDGVARKDIMTYYDIVRLPKCKGFGPRNGPMCEPLQTPKGAPMHDKLIFKNHPIVKQLPKTPFRIPHRGMTTESRENYKPPSHSCFAAHLFDSRVDYPDSLMNASPWQNQCAPGMYCTEYDHIGSGVPVGAVVNVGPAEKKQVKDIVHPDTCNAEPLY